MLVHHVIIFIQLARLLRLFLRLYHAWINRTRFVEAVIANAHQKAAGVAVPARYVRAWTILEESPRDVDVVAANSQKQVGNLNRRVWLVEHRVLHRGQLVEGPVPHHSPPRILKTHNAVLTASGLPGFATGSSTVVRCLMFITILLDTMLRFPIGILVYYLLAAAALLARFTLFACPTRHSLYLRIPDDY